MLEQERRKWDIYYSQPISLNPTPAEQQYLTEVVNYISELLPNGGKILEVGCGSGRQSLALAQTGKFEVSLLDFSTHALNVAQQIFTQNGQTADFILQDGFEKGVPEYDLVFNAGVVEHYQLADQIRLLEAMASRSKSLVLVLAPNIQCYWYWIWRTQKEADHEWTFGEEYPVSDLSAVFHEAGMTFLGQSYLAKSWANDFLSGIHGMEDSVRSLIASINNSRVLPDQQTAYLVAALGSVDPALNHDKQPNNLPQAISTPSVLRQNDRDVHSLSNELDRQTTEIALLQAKLYELAQNQLEMDQSINDIREKKGIVEEKLKEIYRSKAWKFILLYRSIPGKLRDIFFKARLFLAKLKLLWTPQQKNPQPLSSITFDRPDTVYIVTYTFLDADGNNMFYGGAERYVIELADIIKQLGYNAEVIQVGNFNWVRYYHSLRVNGIQSSYLSFKNDVHESIKNCKLIIYSPFSIKHKSKEISSIGISHGVFWDSSSYQELVAMVRGYMREIVHSVELVNVVVSVDTNTINWFRATHYDLASRFLYIPNFVDSSQFHPTNAKNQPDRIIILYPRRLYPVRGFWLLADIIPDLLDRYRNLEFHFVGKANPREEAKVNELVGKFPNAVKWFFLSPDRMHEAYQAATISLIPTIQSEGTSLSCLEAMACGNVVIATNVGGLPDLIINGYNGLLIEPDANALAEALTLVIENPDIRNKLSSNAISVSQSFSIDHWRQRWIHLLRQYLPIAQNRPTQPKPILFPLSPGIGWQGIQQRPHHIAKELSKAGYDVFWMDEAETSYGRLDEPSLSILAPKDDLYFTDPILYIYYPYNSEWLKRYEQSLVIYDILDDIAIHEVDHENQALSHHQKLLERADIVMTSSRSLYEKVLENRPDVLYIPNGVYFEHFNPARVHPAREIKKITGPIIGYHGAVASWFDIDLLLEVARLRPQYTFVVIGPVSEPSLADRLNAQPNIKLLGPKPYEKIAAYIAGFDVGIMPFKINHITQFVRPLKVLEYLSLNKPVVSTPIQELAAWPGVRVAETSGEFVQAVDASLSQSWSHSDRQVVNKFIHNNHWKLLVNPLLAKLEKQLASRSND